MALGLYTFREIGELQIKRSEEARTIWGKSNSLLQSLIEAGLASMSEGSKPNSSTPFRRRVESPYKEIRLEDRGYNLAVRGVQTTRDTDPDQTSIWKFTKFDFLCRLSNKIGYEYASVGDYEERTMSHGVILPVKYHVVDAGADSVSPLGSEHGLEALLKEDQQLSLAVGQLAAQFETAVAPVGTVS